MVIDSLLIFSYFFLIFTSAILFRNLLHFDKLKIETAFDLGFEPSVSVCIPARNEEKVIEDCVDRLLDQTYQNYNILLLNDFSSDKTGQIIQRLASRNDTISIAIEAPKPDDWLGKPWACQQLFEQSTADILIYLDADTKVSQHFIESVVYRMESEELDALTVWPEQITPTFWEKVIVPMIYHALWTLLYSGYVEKAPKWLPYSLRKRFQPLFAAANGQCMVYRRYALIELNGYQHVKDNVVEDVEMARGLLERSLKYKMFYGTGSIRCRMYESLSEIFQGFRKNFFAGFNYNYLTFLAMAVLHIVVFLFPIYTLILGYINQDHYLIYLSLLLVGIPVIQRIILSKLFNWPALPALTHVLGVIFFQILGITTLIDKLLNRKTVWKGREVS